MVYAESAEEASEVMRYEDLGGKFNEEVSEMMFMDGKPILPKGWGKDCIPWGSADDSTIADILASANLAMISRPNRAASGGVSDH